MKYRLIDHAYILSTIIFTVYSQLIMRWQVSLAGPLPNLLYDKIISVGNLLLNPWVISGIVATFFAGVSWMLAMTKFEISYAFPFVSLNYVLVLLLGFVFFQENMSATKLVGSALILFGIIVIAKGEM